RPLLFRPGFSAEYGGGVADEQTFEGQQRVDLGAVGLFWPVARVRHRLPACPEEGSALSGGSGRHQTVYRWRLRDNFRSGYLYYLRQRNVRQIKPGRLGYRRPSADRRLAEAAEGVLSLVTSRAGG